MLPTAAYSPAYKLGDIPGKLPQAVLPEDVDVAEVGQITIKKLNELELDSLTESVIFRDFLTFTDSLRTLTPRDKVYPALKELLSRKNCSPFALSGTEPSKIPFVWIDFNILFTIQHSTLTGSAAGIVSVVQESHGERRIWMLRTWLEAFNGQATLMI